MRTWVLYVVLAMTLAAAFLAGQLALERFTSPLRCSSRRAGTTGAVDRPLDRLVLDLGRLERDYRDIERSQAPARVRRLKAVELAYDDTLRACCRSVGLPEPQSPGMSALDRLHTEAALAQRGVHW